MQRWSVLNAEQQGTSTHNERSRVVMKRRAFSGQSTAPNKALKARSASTSSDRFMDAYEALHKLRRTQRHMIEAMHK